MGSYHEEKITAGSDFATAGSLVWVRRRNGSWWPGRVLGLDELPGKSSVPARSGTPIKLLGREDGSMDWYNLEKSTRVKAFRCGEYDEDIERAKVSAGNPNKKAPNKGKYVRREDAIRHALELESIHSSSESQKVYPGLNNLMGNGDYNSAAQTKSACTQSKKPGYISRKLGMNDVISTQEFSQSVVSFEEPNNLSTDEQITQKKRWKTPYDSEDDGIEETRRTRGLQDLVLGTLSGRKHSILVCKKGSHAPFPVSASLSKSKFDNGFSGDVPINNNRSSFVSLKRKQSIRTQVQENSKKKSRHRPLMKVLKGTTQIPVPSVCQVAPIDQSSFPGFVKNETKVLKTSEINTIEVSVGNGSHRSGTSHEGSSSDASENAFGGTLDGSSSCSEMEDHEHSNLLEFNSGKCSDPVNISLANGARDLGCSSGLNASRKLHNFAPRQFCQLSEVGNITQLHDGETVSASSPIHLNCGGHIIGNKKSRLNLKGKKKSKYVTLSKTTYSEDNLDRADQSGTYLMERTRDNKINSTSSNGQMVKYGSSSDDVSDGPPLETSKTTYLSCLNSLKQGFASEVRVQSAEDLTNMSYALPFARHSEALFTGDIAVSTVSPEKSHMHHLTTCSENQVLEPVDSIPVASQLYDVKLNVQRNYHGPRFPLASLRSKLDDLAIVGHSVTVEVLQNGSSDSLLKKIEGHPIARQTEHLVKSRSNVITKSKPKPQFGMRTRSRSRSRMKIQHMISGRLMLGSPFLRCKSSRSKKSGFSPRKTRRLSSITVDRRRIEAERKLVVEKIVHPAIACIPLRLVFSRINEALSNSARPASCI